MSFLLFSCAGADEPPLHRVEPLCVTLGALTSQDGRDRVEVPKMRAVATTQTAPVAELRFSYLGPTRDVAPMASGVLRRQIGLKLRAADGCNLLYVMWRLDPQSGLVVSLKRNPGQHQSSECGNNGYQNLKARHDAPLPAVAIGTSHVLRAALEDTELTVWADGALVWSGSVPAEIRDIDGPVGMRTDNGRFTLELWAPAGSPPSLACPRGETD